MNLNASWVTKVQDTLVMAYDFLEHRQLGQGKLEAERLL